jgi:TRAP-type C4-dicarboxylate transport system permease small subunit
VLRLVHRLLGRSVGWSIVWCAACLFGGLVGCLCWLVGQSLGHRIIWTIGRLVSCWMLCGFVGCGSGVRSMGRLAIGSLVRFIGGSLCRSVSLSLGRWMGWLVSWLVEGSLGL